jgi:hypothetical protein
VQFLWHFPTSATPLFTLDHGPTALLLKQARGGGMAIAGEAELTRLLSQRCWQQVLPVQVLA